MHPLVCLVDAQHSRRVVVSTTHQLPAVFRSPSQQHTLPPAVQQQAFWFGRLLLHSSYAAEQPGALTAGHTVLSFVLLYFVAASIGLLLHFMVGCVSLRPAGQARSAAQS
jgi:hypothetical protein